MKKLNSCKGETLGEVLISIIVLSLCFIILQTSIVASNRMNKQSKDAVKGFKIPEEPTNADAYENKNVYIKNSAGQVVAEFIGKAIYHTEDGYYYYGE